MQLTVDNGCLINSCDSVDYHYLLSLQVPIIKLASAKLVSKGKANAVADLVQIPIVNCQLANCQLISLP